MEVPVSDMGGREMIWESFEAVAKNFLAASHQSAQLSTEAVSRSARTRPYQSGVRSAMAARSVPASAMIFEDMVLTWPLVLASAMVMLTALARTMTWSWPETAVACASTRA